MAIKFNCFCGKELTADDECYEMRCVFCGKMLLVPDNNGEPPDLIEKSKSAFSALILSLLPVLPILIAAIAYFGGFVDAVFAAKGIAPSLTARLFHLFSAFTIVIAQPIAIIFGSIALLKIKKSEGRLRGETTANIAVILASCWLALILSLLIVTSVF